MRLFRHLFIISIAFTSFFHTAFAQSGFMKGYIITDSGDSIKGSIEKTSISKFYDGCLFLSADGIEKTYNLEEIREFGIYNYAQFRAVEGKDNGFFEVLVDGKITLFHKQDVFLIEKDTSLMDISPNKTSINPDGDEVSLKFKQLGKLKMAVSDCGNIAQSVDEKTSSKKSISALIKTYNMCAEGRYTSFSEQVPLVITKIGVHASLISSNIDFDGMDQDFTIGRLNTSNFSTSYLPAVGLNIMFYSPRIGESLFIDVWPYLSSHNYSATGIIERDFFTSQRNIDIEFLSINVPLGFQYQLSAEHILFGLKAGINYNIVVNQKVEIEGIDIYSQGIENDFSSTHTDLLDNYAAFYGGLILGYKKGMIKNLALDINFQASKKIMPAIGQAHPSYLKTKNLVFTIRYLFDK